MRINRFIVLILPVLFSLYCTKTETAPEYPVFGFHAIKGIQLNENRSDALLSWLEKDFKHVVVLFVSDKNSLNRINSTSVEKMRTIVSSGRLGSISKRQEQLYDNSNYIYGAEKLGIINKVYWVLPYMFLKDIPLAEKKTKRFLRETGGFKEDDIRELKMVSGCLNGTLSGIEVSICSPRTLQLMDEPVIMTIDSGFFPVYAEGHKQSKLSVMKSFFDEMRLRKLQIVHMDISYGTEGGESKTMHRFIAEELFEGISDPEIFKAEKPPELWKHRDMAENMLSGGEGTKVLEYLKGPLKQFPDDIPLKMLNATAEVKAGKDDESFNKLKEICQKDRHYCYGFIDLGNMLVDEKRIEITGRFFKKAAELLPDDPYVTQQRRDYLENNRRTE